MIRQLFFVAALSSCPVLATAEQTDIPDYLELSLTPQYQSLSRDGGHNGNYELDFMGLKTLRQGGEGLGATRLGWWWLRNETVSGLSTNALASRAGLLWDFNDGDAPEPGNFLGVFALQQSFADDKGLLQIGKLYPGNDFAESEYWGDDRGTFMSTMMSGDVAGRWFSTIGLGANAAWFGDGWHLRAGVVDAQAEDPYFDFDSLKKGRFLWQAELGLTPDWGGDFTQIALSPYMIDRTDHLSRERGFVAAFTHEWDDFAVFGRYTWRDGGTALTPADEAEELAVQRGGFLGFAWNAPFDREDDRIAVALMHGEPTPLARAGGLNTQTGIEAYWSIEPNPWTVITPDVQVVRTASGEIETILGLRLKVRFQKSWQ
ncbi:Carbohydrate-selective porin, OprB family [Pseudoruegeria aquimaris]|uniref:Carbohydrate-selective porin, OprB family n=1 Tax=Pseudoruegeria aquimaris TaxID=393663 RepID=A0A1Y5RRJ3_9RHOB|nr:carbohydrate porin [Pseudoruegeria aquimaris]SLN23776.1 Carbohydrate-selective porin, OprB family [Pseudoruegeria aquimaris]